MAKTVKKKKKHGPTMPSNQKVSMAPVKNPALDAAIQALKEGSTPEKQAAFKEALKKAVLLSPCQFDTDVKPDQFGKVKLNPTQIKFFLINTNDGKTFFPAFTNHEQAEKMNAGNDIKPSYVTRTLADYRNLAGQKDNEAEGIIINPGSDSIVVPQGLLDLLVGGDEKIPSAAPEVPAAVNITYREPSVYPTRMVNAVYDRCEETEEIRHVWLKEKIAGNEGSFVFIVDTNEKKESVLNAIREVAVPLGKGVPVEVVYLTDELKEKVIGEAVALFDRELDL